MSRKKKADPAEVMVVNDLPGEECRIAILLDNHLEELYSERTATATSVGNIYKGKVVNVEPAIQAAFIDFGHGQNGFLHISDLHPRYFPGTEKTERVGRKVPHRSRPPIQDSLRRGDEVLVQVLKEGLGTKGPTLTSYLSIPGRLLVAMPFMDRVGVSRKIEDEDKRREMRKILDTLDLPSGFGFILRTAGFGRNKTELKRDVAYLSRLWKVMEKNLKTRNAPCELYTESDLLIRTVRDVLRPSIRAIIVDSDSAYQRASEFLRVVAPRSAPKLIRYRRQMPLFHAFDVERQIELIHCREVPLPSGGALVIDQTEAMVAIDVNSGRSRRARDSETNAFQTNCEAVDEICRQLRLRDLGGLIVNDLIDMRAHKNRRLIEDRVRENLKRDRAKSTALKLSDFGLLEMTRQRMRPSLRKANFVTCIHCNGHGEIKSPEYVASDAVRQIGHLIQYDKVVKIEIVCSPRVASVLLSSKRREMVRLEDEAGKKIEVRVSDSIASDRVDFYAYDARGADISQSSLPPLTPPAIDLLEKEDKAAPPITVNVEPLDDEDEQQDVGEKKRSRRSRRRGGRKTDKLAAEQSTQEDSAAAEDNKPARRKRRRKKSDSQSGPETADTRISSEATTDDEQPQPRKKKRTRRGGRRHRKVSSAPKVELSIQAPMRVHQVAKQLGVTSKELIARSQDDDNIDLKSHMSTIGPEHAKTIVNWFDDSSAADPGTAASNNEAASNAALQTNEADSKPRKKRRRGGRRRRGGGKASDAKAGDNGAVSAQNKDSTAHVDSSDGNADTETATPKRKRRTLYGRRTKVSPEARAQALETSDT